MLLEGDITSSGKLPVISYDVALGIKIQCVSECPSRLDLSVANRKTILKTNVYSLR